MTRGALSQARTSWHDDSAGPELTRHPLELARGFRPVAGREACPVFHHIQVEPAESAQLRPRPDVPVELEDGRVARGEEGSQGM